MGVGHGKRAVDLVVAGVVRPVAVERERTWTSAEKIPGEGKKQHINAFDE